jgi:hypothetical protein
MEVPMKQIVLENWEWFVILPNVILGFIAWELEEIVRELKKRNE